jgi:hypothetical protein
MKVIKDHNQLYWYWSFRDNRYEKVDGDPVIFDGEFGELDFFIYRIRRSYRQIPVYGIADGITGLAVADISKTQKEALGNALRRLTSVGIDYTVNQIYMEMKGGKLSPRYARWFEGCIDDNT